MKKVYIILFDNHWDGASADIGGVFADKKTAIEEKEKLVDCALKEGESLMEYPEEHIPDGLVDMETLSFGNNNSYYTIMVIEKEIAQRS